MLYTFVIGMGAFNVIIPHFVLLELHQRITQIIFVHKSSLFYMNKNAQKRIQPTVQQKEMTILHAFFESWMS